MLLVVRKNQGLLRTPWSSVLILNNILDAAYYDTKDLAKRTIPDKIWKDRA